MKRRPPLVAIFLIFVFAVFLALLAMTWIVARRSSPVMLDERGNPRTAAR